MFERTSQFFFVNFDVWILRISRIKIDKNYIDNRYLIYDPEINCFKATYMYIKNSIFYCLNKQIVLIIEIENRQTKIHNKTVKIYNIYCFSDFHDWSRVYIISEINISPPNYTCYSDGRGFNTFPMGDSGKYSALKFIMLDFPHDWVPRWNLVNHNNLFKSNSLLLIDYNYFGMLDNKCIFSIG